MSRISTNTYVLAAIIIFFLSEKDLLCTEGTQLHPSWRAAFLKAARTLLSSSLFLLAQGCVPTLLDELEGLLVFGDPEHLHGMHS